VRESTTERQHETPTATADELFRALLAFVRGVFVVLGALAVLPVIATLVLRQVPVTSPALAAYVAATPLVVFVGLGAIVLFVAGGSRIGIAVASVLAVVLVLTQVPLYLGTGAVPGDAVPLTVLTINMHYGGGDAEAIVAAVRAHDVDVLATQELTRPAVDRLRAAGIEDVLPYGLTNGGYGAAGNGIWSRYPLTRQAVAQGLMNPPVAATIDVAGRTVFVATVHPVSPYPDDTAEWSHELGLLADWFDVVQGPAFVAGDFNATRDHQQFRRVLAAGFQDAAAQVGAGWLPTYPVWRRRIPPLITIDHVITSRGVVATAVDRIVIPDTDHMVLVVRLAIERV
jgi:endonuclease/exonuclease/phosphatase (EEP) superfamily protein YafD